MEDRLRELLLPAFREVDAREANEAIASARREKAGSDSGDELRSYELVLTTWDAFVREQVGKLVYHLESMGAHLPDCRGVLISAFLGDRLYFVEAHAFVAQAGRMLGLTAEQLSERYGLGESRTAVREPLLLPGPKN
jgi:hypothetical protein